METVCRVDAPFFSDKKYKNSRINVGMFGGFFANAKVNSSRDYALPRFSRKQTEEWSDI